VEKEEDEGYGIRPAPGTCCPDMRIKDGVCQGCGKVYILKAEIFVKCPEKGLIPVSECVECEYFDSMNPVDAVYCKYLRFERICPEQQ